jgi:hypothetical protein
LNAKASQLKQALDLIRRRWGEDALRPLALVGPPSSAIPTGFPELDSLLGGGLPRGKISELAGVPTSGTTTLAYSTLGKAQSLGHLTVYIDLHHIFDPLTAATCGVQVDRLLLVRPPDLVSALDVLRVVAGEDGVGLAVLDDISLALSNPRLMSKLETTLRRLKPALQRSNPVPGPGCAVVLLNLKGIFSPSLQTASLRLYITLERWLADGQEIVGYQSRVTISRSQGRSAGQEVLVTIGLGRAAREDAA